MQSRVQLAVDKQTKKQTKQEHLVTQRPAEGAKSAELHMSSELSTFSALCWRPVRHVELTCRQLTGLICPTNMWGVAVGATLFHFLNSSLKTPLWNAHLNKLATEIHKVQSVNAFERGAELAYHILTYIHLSPKHFCACKRL